MASEAGKGSKPRPIFNQKQFDDNFDLIFKKPLDQQEPKCTCIDSAYERQAMSEGLNNNPVFPENAEWNEKRIDIIGTNGNDGLHYKK
jgi:hypothetical protein